MNRERPAAKNIGGIKTPMKSNADELVPKAVGMTPKARANFDKLICSLLVLVANTKAKASARRSRLESRERLFGLVGSLLKSGRETAREVVSLVEPLADSLGPDDGGAEMAEVLYATELLRRSLNRLEKSLEKAYE